MLPLELKGGAALAALVPTWLLVPAVPVELTSGELLEVMGRLEEALVAFEGIVVIGLERLEVTAGLEVAGPALFGAREVGAEVAEVGMELRLVICAETAEAMLTELAEAADRQYSGIEVTVTVTAVSVGVAGSCVSLPTLRALVASISRELTLTCGEAPLGELPAFVTILTSGDVACRSSQLVPS